MNDAEIASPWLRRAQVSALMISLGSCLALALCYAGRFDACAAITVFPVWAWLVPGLFLTALGMRRKGNRLAGYVLMAWILNLLALAEEPWSLLRLVMTHRSATVGDDARDRVRVVSLNCNVGNVSAAEEGASSHPDIVLFQESPGRPRLDAVAKKLFGADALVVSGVDGSMIVRGRLVSEPVKRSSFVQARVQLVSGIEVEVFSLRLLPAVFRLDLWSPGCWREQSENRRKRREEVRAIAQRVASIPRGIPVIIGGDFNAPQGDEVFRLLTPRLHDAFREGGRGWGNTVINDLPVLRIDQVWISQEFRAIDVVSKPTRHSDHRMVSSDLIVRMGKW